MFFNQEVEKLSHKAELYVVWAWVSFFSAIAAVYKYIETNWPGYPVISGILVLLAIVLTLSAKKLKQEMISIETDERDEEIEKEKRTALKKNMQDFSKKEDENNAFLKEIEKEKRTALRKKMQAFSKKEDEYNVFLKEVKSRSLEENIKLLDSKYNSLSNKDKIANYGEYEKSLKWLKVQYK